MIDPVTQINALIVLDDTGSTDYTLDEGPDDDFILYPLNETEKTRVQLLAHGQLLEFREGFRRVAITGLFRSDTSVPSTIKIITIKLAARIIENTTSDKEISQESLGDYSVSYITQSIEEASEAMGVFNQLDQYRHYVI